MNKKLRYMMLCLSLFAFGCNDWLDVQPKSQVKEEDLFSSESGFRDALTGIYALMGRVETYGGNSTMGFMDMLAQTYSKVDYDYEDAFLQIIYIEGRYILVACHFFDIRKVPISVYVVD